PARRPVVATDPLVAFNRRVAAATALAAATVLTRLLDASIWTRDVMLPREARRLAHAAAVGRVQSRAGLEGMREATAHLQYAARAWYAAAGQPAIDGLAGKATGAVRTARAARRGLRPAGQVVDIQAILSAQSIGWYGPFSTVPVPPLELEGAHDVADSGQSDRLAS